MLNSIFRQVLNQKVQAVVLIGIVREGSLESCYYQLRCHKRPELISETNLIYCTGDHGLYITLTKLLSVREQDINPIKDSQPELTVFFKQFKLTKFPYI